jgi:hypothetical protein
MKSLAFASLAALLFGACVINDDVNDDDADTGSNPSSDPSTTTVSTTDASTTDDPSTTASTTASTTDASTTDTPADTGSSTDVPSDTGSTGEEGTCGWGRTGEKTIPEGYICGGEGEDPTGLMPSTCAEGVELVEGGDCGGEMGITGVGCCDANGDVWFCADDGSGRQLFTQDC